jgi:HEAT repeat protein
MDGQSSGLEPSLSQGQLPPLTGMEPMLGGFRRHRLDRDTFWALLDISDRHNRSSAINRVLDEGLGQFYRAAMIAVLAPAARYYKVGHIWKVPYDYEHKLAAMDSLVRLDPTRALSGLIYALKNDDLRLQQAAILFIGRLEEEAAEQALLAVLDDPRREMRLAATYALSRRWGRPELRQLFSGRSALISRAARDLAELGQSRLLEPLKAVLQEQISGALDQQIVQSAIISALGRLGQLLGPDQSAPVVEVLRQLVDESRVSQTLTWQVVEALQMIGTEEAQAAAIVYRAGHLAL